MKKAMTLILTALFLFAFTGCLKSEQPEKTVTDFCEALKNYDVETMRLCFKENVGQEGESPAAVFEYDEKYDDTFRNIVSQITYEITSTEENEDKASVTVKFTYPDMSTTVADIMEEYIKKIFISSFFGTESDSSDSVEEAVESIMEKAKTTEGDKVNAEVKFECTKEKTGWLIDEMPDEMYDIATAKILKTLENVLEKLEA